MGESIDAIARIPFSVSFLIGAYETGEHGEGATDGKDRGPSTR
jgi:hypothetical protein